MAEVLLPALTEMMETGTIIAWLKRPGETVREGEPLVEIETDKATVVLDGKEAGTFEPLCEEGDEVAVGQPIATIGAAVATAEQQGAAPLRASPIARRLAVESGIDLASVAGSGPSGRIGRDDVEAAIKRRAGEQQSASAPVPAAEPAALTGGEVVTASSVQRSIARRMSEAHASIPDFTVQADVDMRACRELREDLRALGTEPLPSYNDMVLRATALMLVEHPEANASFRGETLERHASIDLGLAVAVAGALLVPRIRAADRKPLLQLAAETKELIGRAQRGAAGPAELTGATFTVSNLGMFGVERIFPIVNPPQGAILGVGAIKPTPLAVADRVEIRPLMCLTLVCDHRLLYGAEAAQMLSRIRDLLEHPSALLVEDTGRSI